MTKRTLYFGSPARLSTELEQLVVVLTDTGEMRRLPLEDIGLIELDHPQISITQPCLARMIHYQVALVCCDASHHPSGLLLPLEGHAMQSRHQQAQVAASQAFKNKLWQTVIRAKIGNQVAVLRMLGKDTAVLDRMPAQVKPGDADNREAQAARLYWAALFGHLAFTRERYGTWPNALLNYGYAIVRAAVARALVGAGLLPGLGIKHHNQYNAFNLADDMMEPYRPLVDLLVYELHDSLPQADRLTRVHKQELLTLPTLDVQMGSERRPLAQAINQTALSLVHCYLGEAKTLELPTLCPATADTPTPAPND